MRDHHQYSYNIDGNMEFDKTCEKSDVCGMAVCIGTYECTHSFPKSICNVCKSQVLGCMYNMAAPENGLCKKHSNFESTAAPKSIPHNTGLTAPLASVHSNSREDKMAKQE